MCQVNKDDFLSLQPNFAHGLASLRDCETHVHLQWKQPAGYQVCMAGCAGLIIYYALFPPHLSRVLQMLNVIIYT